jgi:hypothetical protein
MKNDLHDFDDNQSFLMVYEVEKDVSRLVCFFFFADFVIALSPCTFYVFYFSCLIFR